MFIAPLLLASTASLAAATAPCNGFTLSLNQTSYAPTELINLDISGAPGTLGWLLLDLDPGPTVLGPTLTLDIGFSPALVIFPLALGPSGSAQLSHVGQCGRVFFDTPLNAQAVAIDLTTFELCASNAVQIVGNRQGFCGDCLPCSGGVTELNLRYLGDQSAFVEVYRKNQPGSPYFADIVDPSEAFIVADGGNVLGSHVQVRVDGVPHQLLKVNCSAPIAPGIEFGSFRILGAKSKNGGQICPLDQTKLDCTNGKAARLGLRYTGSDCSASDNNQGSGSWFCSGDPSGAAQVRVVVFLHAGQNYFDGIVSPGDLFEIDSATLGLNNLKANTYVRVYSLSGSLLQDIGFHTSCSQPLGVGDVFGSIEIVEFVPDLQ